MMRQLMTQHRSTAAARGGFTLIEMLVATTLVVMMMLMFAQMYIAAIGSLSEQQAVARNDGKTRLAETLIRADLRRMSFQSKPGSNQGLLPLVYDESPDDWQKGYFYLSENDQINPVDDVLQFTTQITGNVRNPDQSAYFGRAKSVPGLSVAAFPNHPDVDDGDDSNQVGSSRAAEVSLFVRNGNLYRRVLLLRDVDLQAGGISAPAQPSNPSTLTEFGATIAPNSGTGAPSFYKAFDYAAYCRIDDKDNPLLDSTQFIGTSRFLDNNTRPREIGAAVGGTESLGCSMYRFGFAISPENQTATVSDSVLRAISRSRGQPVEYDSLGNFFGRPIHAETGSYLWGWPGTRYNPLLDTNLQYGVTKVDQLSFTGANTPIVDSVTNPASANYTRATEDLLLSNVEAFDVEVWDQGQQEVDLNSDGNLDAQEDLNSNGVFDVAAGFVQLGHSGVVKNGVTTLTGYMRDAQRLNRFYGPGTDPNGVKPNIATLNWVFDTGHPDMWTEAPRSLDAPFTAYGAAQRPPYRPLMYRAVDRDVNTDNVADGNEDANRDRNFVLDEDLNDNGIFDPGEDLNGNGIFDRDEDINNNNILDLGEDKNSNGILDLNEDTNHNGYWDLAEDLNGNGVFDPAPVNPVRAANQWYPNQQYPYSEDRNNNGVLDPGEDDNRNGILDEFVNVVFRPSGTTCSDDNTYSIAYRCLNTTSATSGKTAPDFPSNPGQQVKDGDITWEAFDNRVGLQKIRITVRLRDPIEGVPRQFSIVHTFANPK